MALPLSDVLGFPLGGGTGRELAIAKQIIERHGGEFGRNRNQASEPLSTSRYLKKGFTHDSLGYEHSTC